MNSFCNVKSVMRLMFSGFFAATVILISTYAIAETTMEKVKIIKEILEITGRSLITNGMEIIITGIISNNFFRHLNRKF